MDVMHSKRILALVAVAGACGVAQAQVTPLRVEAAYYRSNNFNGSYLSGIELGISQSLLSLPIVGEVRLGASAMFGRALGMGGLDGNLYRLHGTYKTPSAGPNGLYGLAGLNWQTAQARNSSFGNESGFGVQFGVGLPLSTGLPGIPSASIEAMYRIGPKAPLRGFSVGVGVRF